MTMAELIAKLPTEKYQSHIYIRVEGILYPVNSVTTKGISTHQTLIVLSNDYITEPKSDKP